METAGVFRSLVAHLAPSTPLLHAAFAKTSVSESARRPRPQPPAPCSSPLSLPRVCSAPDRLWRAYDRPGIHPRFRAEAAAAAGRRAAAPAQAARPQAARAGPRRARTEGASPGGSASSVSLPLTPRPPSVIAGGREAPRQDHLEGAPPLPRLIRDDARHLHVRCDDSRQRRAPAARRLLQGASFCDYRGIGPSSLYSSPRRSARASSPPAAARRRPHTRSPRPSSSRTTRRRSSTRCGSASRSTRRAEGVALIVIGRHATPPFDTVAVALPRVLGRCVRVYRVQLELQVRRVLLLLARR